MEKKFKNITEATFELNSLGYILKKYRLSNTGSEYNLFVNESTCDYVLLHEWSELFSRMVVIEVQDKDFLLKAIKGDNFDCKLFSPSLVEFLEVIEILEAKKQLDNNLPINNIGSKNINKI